MEDSAKGKSRPAAATAGATAHDILREFVEDIHTVYGRHDGKPDALDEELLDWPDLVATYRKARSLLGRDFTSPTTNQE